MDNASTVFPQKIHWESDGTSRIPFMAYTGADQHRKELERFFYRKHWCYVALEAEIPNPGDFKRTVVGERSGGGFPCPYHQWNYTLQGDLQGVPFRRGVKQDGKVNGGMPGDFKTA